MLTSSGGVQLGRGHEAGEQMKRSLVRHVEAVFEADGRDPGMPESRRQALPKQHLDGRAA